jgi:hypothetical protein
VEVKMTESSAVYNHLFTFTCCFRGITGALPVRRLELPSTGVF